MKYFLTLHGSIRRSNQGEKGVAVVFLSPSYSSYLLVIFTTSKSNKMKQCNHKLKFTFLCFHNYCIFNGTNGNQTILI